MSFNVGDTVRCVSPSLDLTVGNQYKVLSKSDDGYFTRVVNDRGTIDGFSKSTFEKVDPEEVFRDALATFRSQGYDVEVTLMKKVAL